MKVQRVEMFVCPSATPSDTSGLQALADAGKVTRDNLVALLGKTDGTGFHADWGGVWADAALREWTAGLLGVPKDEVAKHVIFVLSGGCPGVITPHIAAVTRDWVEVGQPGSEKRLAVGRAGSDAIPPEEVGRMGMIRKVAAATEEAMKDAGITDPKDVHLVMVKVPGLTVGSIKDAESRGHTVVSHDLTFGPEGAGSYANDEADFQRLVHVFAKSVIPGTDQVRGQHITLLDDHNAYQIGKALGGMLVASVTGRTTNYVSGGERNSHQGPPGGNIVAAVVRAD